MFSQIKMVSVIIPINNESGSVRVLNNALVNVMEGLSKKYEIIYVDDGSTDESFNLLTEFVRVNRNIKAIRLAKNFGQTLAMQAGIDFSSGDVIVFMDSDLQNDSSDIPRLLKKIEEGYDVVSGWRKNRKDGLLSKKLPSFVGNKLIHLLFGIRIHDLGCTLKGYKKDVLRNIRLYGEMHRLLPLYAALQGASVAEIEVSHKPRLLGKTHYGWSRIFKIGLDLITIKFFELYSTKPMYFFGGVGAIMSILGVLLGAIVMIRTLFFGGSWVSPLLFISLMFVSIGIQLILLGLLAEITIRIYYRVESEHSYLVKDKVGDF